MFNIYPSKKLINVIKKEETICLTGHRPNKLPWFYDETKNNCIRFKEDLRKILEGAIKYGIKNFLSGMAEGFDMIATELLLELRKKYKEIKIIAVIPCLGQEKRWSVNQQKRYNKILKQCDDSVIISKEYTINCMNDRNRFMVEHSSIVIACYNGFPSGTGNTIKYAKENACKIKIISPVNYVE
ncbi:MAG: SLOG family protein [Christensenellales bacterium]